MAPKMTKTRAAAELSVAETRLEEDNETTPCRRKPRNFQFPPGSNGPTPSRALRMCKPCPIMAECHAYGRMFGHDTGLIWGGRFYKEEETND